MENPMRSRVVARLAELRLKPSSVHLREKLEAAGLNRTFLSDFVSERKKSIQQKHIPVIADILGIDASFLNGDTAPLSAPYMNLSGICEADAWRMPGADIGQALPVMPDPRHPAIDQVAMLVRGNHAEKYGISDGSIVIAQTKLQPRSGEMVVAERRRSDGATELSIRKFVNSNLAATHLENGDDSTPLSEFRIIGVVVLAIRTF